MRLAIAILLMSLIATFTCAGTLRDNFDDGDWDGWTRATWGVRMDQSAQWFVEDGELVCTSENICALASGLTIGDNRWKDYEFSCQFKIEKTSEKPCWTAGVVMGVRYEKTGSLADFGLMSQGPNLWNTCFCELWTSLETSKRPDLLNSCPSIEENRWYIMRAVVDENDFKLFIDNELLFNFQSDIPDKGGAALFARDCEAHFDNVVIVGDEIPDMDVSTAVSPQAKLTTAWGIVKSH